MKTINLKEYYPNYTIDTFLDVPNEVAEMFESFSKAEIAYERKKYRYNAHYSLDRNDGIEHSILFISLSPDDIYDSKLMHEQLHTAISTLPEKQAKRIYAYYFIGMSKTAIAKAEGVNKSQISRSISKALKNIEKFLKSTQ